jgi:multidrug efflux pump subunit AcrA (membrane-fusion protein)
LALLALIAGPGIAFCFPQVRQLAAVALDRLKPAHADDDGHDHAEGTCASQEECGHDHEKETDGHEGHNHEEEGLAESHADDHKHDEAEAVKLSAKAQENVGLRLEKVALRPFERTISVPAIVVERPGRTSLQVAAPLTGVITRIWPLQGETVTPGQPLFDLRLTHEEVVEAQTEFLRTAEELDVLEREIARLEKVSADGAIAGKTLLERKYEQQKLLAAQRSQRQRLLLHGLSPQQVDGILAKRTLLGEITVAVPQNPGETGPRAKVARTPNAPEPNPECVLQVVELKADQGQHVKAGDPLCVLADYTELSIQGKAFEQDAPALDRALGNDWRVTAVIDSGGRQRQTVSDLRIMYVANKLAPESRAFLFYVQLPNKVVARRQTADGHRFSAWQFKPGQRVELLVPAERWADRIVLPVSAVVQDGPESYVFEENEGHFDRRSVRVEYRDQFSAVIANDGTLTPGKTVIISGAYRVHLAMKNKAGGAPDPHAGHNH